MSLPVRPRADAKPHGMPPLAAGACAGSRVPAVRLSLRTVPMILMYHGVGEVADDPNQLFVTPDRFTEQMAWLSRRGLRGVGAGTLFDALRAGRARGMVGITFDDGYAGLLESALPALRRHGFGGTVFVVAGRLGGSNEWDAGPSWPLLDAAGVRELASAGIEIGSHGATHARLTGLSPAALTAEVSGSRALLSALIGAAVRGIAYPYGAMDANARRAARQAGYSYACAVRTAVSDLDVMALPRIYAGQQDGAARMAIKRRLYRPYIAMTGRRSGHGK